LFEFLYEYLKSFFCWKRARCSRLPVFLLLFLFLLLLLLLLLFLFLSSAVLIALRRSCCFTFSRDNKVC